MKGFLKTAISLLLAVSALSCSKEGVNGISIIDERVIDGCLYMKIGEFCLLDVVTTPPGRENALIYESSNPAVVTASEGAIVAVGPGYADVTISSVNGKSVVLQVFVSRMEITDFSAPSQLEVGPGYSNYFDVNIISGVGMTEDNKQYYTGASLLYEITGANADKFSYSVSGNTITVTCASDAPQDGSCTAVLNIKTKEEGGKVVSVNLVAILRAVTSVSMSPSSIAELFVGASASISATVYPTNATAKDIEWSVDSPNVNIQADGNKCVVAGVSAGTAKVYATAKSNPAVKAVCTVNVVEPYIKSLDASFGRTSVLCVDGTEDDATSRTLSVKIQPSGAFVPQVENLTPEIWDLDGMTVKNPKKAGWGSVRITAGSQSIVRKLLVVDRNVTIYTGYNEYNEERDSETGEYTFTSMGSLSVIPGVSVYLYYGYMGKWLDYPDFSCIATSYGIDMVQSSVSGSGWTQSEDGKGPYVYVKAPKSLGQTAVLNGKFNGKTCTCNLKTDIQSITFKTGLEKYSTEGKTVQRGGSCPIRLSDYVVKEGNSTIAKKLQFCLNATGGYGNENIGSSYDTSMFNGFTLRCDREGNGVTVEKNQYLQYMTFSASAPAGNYVIWFEEFPEVKFTLNLTR